MRGLSAATDRRTLAGALIVLATVAGVLALWKRPNPFADHVVVHAAVADAGSLAPIGTEVRMSGTPVGKVSHVERQDGHALLTLELDPDAGTIHSDARLRLRPRVAFEGPAVAELDPGSRDAPALGGAAIPLAQTSAAVSLQDVLRAADAPTRAALQQAADELAAGLSPSAAAGFNGTLGRAPELLRTSGEISRAARGPHGDDLSRAVDGLARTADAVAARERDLVPLLEHVRATADAADAAGGGTALRETVAALPEALRRLADGGAALQRVGDRLGPLAHDLRPAARQLEPTLRAATPLLADARPALRGATPLLSDVRGALRAGEAAAPALRRLVDAASPTVGILQRTLLPALLARTNAGAPAYLMFLNLFQGGGGASRYFSRAADRPGPFTPGDGHYMRFGFRFLTGFGYPAPRCDLLAKANAQLADTLSKAGACTP